MGVQQDTWEKEREKYPGKKHVYVGGEMKKKYIYISVIKHTHTQEYFIYSFKEIKSCKINLKQWFYIQPL